MSIRMWLSYRMRRSLIQGRRNLTQCGDRQGWIAVQGREGVLDLRIGQELREIEERAQDGERDLIDLNAGAGPLMRLGRLRGGGRRRSRSRCGLVDDQLELAQ